MTVSPSPDHPPRWLAALLLGEGALLVGVVAFYLLRLREEPAIQAQGVTEWAPEPLALLAISVVFGLVGLAAVGAALGAFFVARAAWLAAMLTQAASLLACLTIYLQLAWRPGFLYPLMLYNIVMVLYLNSFDVRSRFHVT